MDSGITNILARFPRYRGCTFDLEDLPTRRQFKYAVALGIVQKRMSFASVSDAIDEAKKGHIEWVDITEDEANELYDAILAKAPVDGQDRETFQMMHVKLPCGCNATDAEAIEDYLSDDEQFVFRCPFCKRQLPYNDWLAGIMVSEACPKCGASWKNLVIQTEISRGKHRRISANVTTKGENSSGLSVTRGEKIFDDIGRTSYSNSRIERMPNGYSVTLGASPSRNNSRKASSTGCLLFILLPCVIWIICKLA